MLKKITNSLNFKNLLILLLIIIIYLDYKSTLKRWFFLYKNNYSTYGIINHPEDLEFLNKVINKYFTEDDLSSPTFYFSPYELGIHILGDGYRLDNFRIKNKYLIKNKNSLITIKNTPTSQNNLKIINSEISNIHGIFVDIIDSTKKISYYKKNKAYILENNKLVSCNDIVAKKNFFASDKENSKKKILSFKNCKYYQFSIKNNLFTSIKLHKDEEIFFENVKKVQFYGNNLDINPYVIIDSDFNNYNYFYSVDHIYVN